MNKNLNGPISSRTDRRKTVQGIASDFRNNLRRSSQGSQLTLTEGLLRQKTLPLTVRNADVISNQDEFNQKATGQLAITSNVSLTESKLIIALKK